MVTIPLSPYFGARNEVREKQIAVLTLQQQANPETSFTKPQLANERSILGLVLCPGWVIFQSVESPNSCPPPGSQSRGAPSFPAP
jgi:hypothetical protein